MVRPFNHRLQNFRAGFMHISSWIVLVISVYYNTDTNNINTVHSNVPAKILLGVLIACVIVSFCVLLFEIVKLIKKIYKKCKKNKI